MMDLIAQKDPKSPVAEAFRTLRTNIQFAGVDGGLKRIVFTSATENEGKSTIVSNLGIVMAQAGSKVVLLDCDFRNPTQHKIFQLENKGLSNCVASGQNVLDIVQKSGIEGLDILTSGPVAAKPSEILASKRMKEVLQQLGEYYDYILIDTPPILPVTDAAILGAFVDGVVFVMSWNKITPQVAKEAKTRLEQAGSRIIGVVLDKVEIASHGYGYGYEYSYGNGKE